jgi:ubiquinone biosynthesis protein COQ9
MLDAADVKQRLLDAALRRVPELGWSSAALHMAARDLALAPAVVGLMPNSAADLVQHFLERCNEAVAAELRGRGDAYAALDTREKVHTALKLRLEMLLPHMSHWSQALAVLAQPQNAAIAASALSSTVDTIWYAAGDTSTDGSWYTKRAALGAVLTSSQLYMLADTSPGLVNTWSFLERRVSDMFLVGGLGEAAGRQLQDLLGGLLGGVMMRAAGGGQQAHHQAQEGLFQQPFPPPAAPQPGVAAASSGGAAAAGGAAADGQQAH